MENKVKIQILEAARRCGKTEIATKLIEEAKKNGINIIIEKGSIDRAEAFIIDLEDHTIKASHYIKAMEDATKLVRSDRKPCRCKAWESCYKCNLKRGVDKTKKRRKL